MGSITYSGSFGGNRASQGLTATSNKGSALPAGAVITRVYYTLAMSAEKSSSNYRWVVSEFAVGGQNGSPAADYKTFTMSSHEQTVSADMNFSASDVDKFTSSSISVYVDAHTTYDSPSYAWEWSVTVEYNDVGYCTAPDKVWLDSTAAAPNNEVQLRWSGAKAGNNNSIAGYEVHRSTSPDSGYTRIATVGAVNNTPVKAPTDNGTTYYYKVKAIGSSANYSSGLSTAYAALSCSYSSVGAPTELSVNVTNVAPGADAVLSWSGATAGSNNTIKGYEVHKASSADGDYVYEGGVTTSATEGTFPVKAPTGSGEANYYKVKTLGTLANSDSALSGVYAALSCTYSAPTAPSRVTVNGAATAYAYPDKEVVLSWSGATAGANNAITGYDIYRDGELFKEGLAPTVSSYNVPAHSTAGTAHTYAVVTRGAHSDSTKSKSVMVYAFTDPTAPTAVSVSEAVVAPGARVTLSWSGALAGDYNDIQGYRVYRSVSLEGAYTLVSELSGGVLSCYVDAPYNSGDAYYYRVETVGTHTNSGRSAAYANVTAFGDAGEQEDEFEVVVLPKPLRKKRGFIFGDYDTATDGKWTITGWSFAEPEPQTKFVSVPSRTAGPLDMSTAQTDGDPTYGLRELAATFECSDGDRLERDAEISKMTNRLHGQREEIVFPDDATRYAIGRLRVKKNYSDPAHASVTVNATCEPWRYSKMGTRVEFLVDIEERKAHLGNSGRCVLVPEVTVTGYNANVTLKCEGYTWELDAGTYRLPELKIKQGGVGVTFQGSGTLTFEYREAIL